MHSHDLSVQSALSQKLRLDKDFVCDVWTHITKETSNFTGLAQGERSHAHLISIIAWNVLDASALLKPLLVSEKIDVWIIESLAFDEYGAQVLRSLISELPRESTSMICTACLNAGIVARAVYNEHAAHFLVSELLVHAWSWKELAKLAHEICSIANKINTDALLITKRYHTEQN